MSTIGRRALALSASLTLPLGLAACAGSNSNDSSGGTGSDTNECATDSYPTKQVDLVIPYEAGGGTDSVMRPFAKSLEKYLGQSVVVVNKAGGGGIVGTASAFSAAPDGYTVAAPIESLLTVQPSINKDVPFSLDTVKTISVAKIAQLIVVGKDQPYESMEDYLKAAEEQPGKIRYGVPGVATDNDLVGHGLELAADVDLRSVPFAGGGAESMRALMRGDVESSVIIYPTVKGSVDAGDLRVLGVMADERLDALPDVPSLSDLDLDSDQIFPTGISIAVPEKTDNAIVEVLSCATEKALQDDELLNLWTPLGINTAFEEPDQSRERLEKVTNDTQGLLDAFPELTTK